MNTKVMFSSASDDWSTPQAFFDKLNEEFNFTLDVCASPENAKCALYIDKESDGLKQSWLCDVDPAEDPKYRGAAFCNPPYGRGIGAWVKKARITGNAGRTVVCLLPARTDTAWWHDDVLSHGAEVRFVRGRLRFGGAKNSAPFPSAVIVFRGEQ